MAAPEPSLARKGAEAEPSAPAASRSIAQEVAQLDVARRSLSAGDPGASLRTLDEYEQRYKGGMLHQEATLLRIEALAAAGDLGSARRVADRFLRDHPRSPHEQRIRALVSDGR